MTDNADDPRETGGIAQDDARLWRSENTNRLLFHSFRVFEERLLQGAHALGYDGIRLIHFNVMRHVDVAGTRMSALAERAGITSGAMTQAVNTCVRDGLVTVGPDPQDGRARLVTFTPDGLELLDVLYSLFHDVERDMIEILGQEGFADFRRYLMKLKQHFHVDSKPMEPAAHRPDTPAARDRAGRRRLRTGAI